MKNVFFRKVCASLLVIMLAFVPLLSSVGFATNDVNGHWAEDTLNKWINGKLANGYPDGTFKPNKSVTRAEFMALVNRSFGYSEGKDISFADVSKDQWYYDTISVAAKAGYIGGYNDNTMKPTNQITRQEVASIISRLLSLSGSDVQASNFSDSSSIPSWSKQQIDNVVAKGLMKGFPDNSFQPVKPITRAEAIVTLDRALESNGSVVKSVDVTYDKPGVYGSEKGQETIEGNVEITAANVTLRNTVIEGNLTIAKEVGEGEVFLKGVTVKGKTYVNGGGENSIHFEDTVLLTVIVNKADGTVRIVATGKTTVQEVTLQSSAKVEQTGSEGVAFRSVTLAEALPANSQVTLVGNFENVDIQAATVAVTIPRGSIQNLMVAADATGTSLNLSQDAKIVSLVLDAAAKILGTGVIETASGKGAKESSFEQAPNKVEGTTTSGGGGGGSSSGDSPNSGFGKIKTTVIDDSARLKIDRITTVDTISFSFSDNTYKISTNGNLKEVIKAEDILVDGLPEGVTSTVKNNNGTIEIQMNGRVDYFVESSNLNSIEDLFDSFLEGIETVLDGYPKGISVVIKSSALTNQGAKDSDPITLQINPPFVLEKLDITEGFTTGDAIKLQFSESINFNLADQVNIALINGTEDFITTGDAIVIYTGKYPDFTSDDPADRSLLNIISMAITNQDFVTADTTLLATVANSGNGVLSFKIIEVEGADGRIVDYSVSTPYEGTAVPGNPLVEQGALFKIITPENEIEYYSIFEFFMLIIDMELVS